MPCKKCALNLKSDILKEKGKNWLFSNHFLSRLAQCISMKLDVFVQGQWSYLVQPNKSARIYLNVFGHTVTRSSKSGKHEKAASFPCRGRKNLRIYSWYSLLHLKHDQKRFIRIPSLNVQERRPLGTFSQFY